MWARSASITTGILTAAEVEVDGEVAAALARSWDAIRARHDEVPPVMLAVVSHRCTARKRCLGGFVPARWSPTHEREPPRLQALRKEFDDAIARGDLAAAMGASGEALLIGALRLSADAGGWLDEVFVTDDGLCGSAVDVLGTLLHEAGHARARVRGVRDTSRQGRYHNPRFKAVAEELGLEVRRDPLIGSSVTTLSADTATGYSDTLSDLARARSTPTAGNGRPPPRFTPAGCWGAGAENGSGPAVAASPNCPRRRAACAERA